MKFDNNHIVKDLQQGDHKTFNDLFECYYHPMCLFISHIIKEKSTVEDIVTDCFIKLWEDRKSIKIHNSIQNYLLTAAKNSAISHLRKNKLQQVDVEKIYRFLLDEEPPVIKEADRYNKLYEAINKLPEQRRRILQLATFEGKSYAGISAELQISVNTVKTQISRAYRFLRSELDTSDKKIMELLAVFSPLSME